MSKINWFIMWVLLVCFETSALGNLVVNGDFEAGNTSFSTGYTYTDQPDGLCYDGREGYYAIGSDPYYYHHGAVSYGDHTPSLGNINMMIVNGATVPNVTVWEQTLSVSPDTDYEFSFWLSNWASTPDLPLAHLEYFINGDSIGSCFEPNSSEAGQWVKVSQIWRSGLSTTATIRIVDIETAISTNDFAIDDISFVPEPATLVLLTLGGIILRRKR